VNADDEPPDDEADEDDEDDEADVGSRKEVGDQPVPA
jgi:hypothetical protein